MKKLLGILVLGLLLTQFQYQTLKAANVYMGAKVYGDSTSSVPADRGIVRPIDGISMAAVVYDGEDLLKAQIIKTSIYEDGCWSIPLYLDNINGDTLEGNNRDGKYGGLPLDQNIIVRVKLEFSDNGFVNKATMINTRVNERWTRHIFVLLASSALRAIVLCQPRNGYFDTVPTKHLWLNLNWRKATK